MRTITAESSSEQTGDLRPVAGLSGDERAQLWARGCATSGAVVWAGLSVMARLGLVRVGSIELLFVLAPLVIVPLGMELWRAILGRNFLFNVARRLQPITATLAVAGMLIPPGRVAGALGCAWLIDCAFVAGAGLIRLSRSRSNRMGEVMGAIAGIDLAVGASWLVASRLGMRPLGIQEPIGLLTAVHFHFAGFATVTIAAATLRFKERTGIAAWLKWLAILIAVMPYVVAAGFVTSPALKMGAALVFSVMVTGLAVVLRKCAAEMERHAGRIFLQVAAAAVFAGMMLSGAYAILDLLGSDVLTIPQMARTHGVLNAVGFCLPGLLGWLQEGERTSLAAR